MLNTERLYKGKSLTISTSNYFVIDLETTGLSTEWDEIIELGAYKISDGKIVDSFNSLVKPSEPVSEFITKLTGITNDMLKTAPKLSKILPSYLEFIGDSIVVGHNVNFDINFLYDNSMLLLKKPLTNSFIDTLRLSRKLYPEFENHKLSTLVSCLNLSDKVSHRSLDDCELAFKCYETMKEKVNSEGKSFESIFKRKYNGSFDARDIKPTTDDFDTSHPFYAKNFVFTGVLNKMQRKEAMQIVTNYGGICQNGINKDTNYLILGNNDYCTSIKDGKSSKHKKAEEKILNGQDLLIIPEDSFYDMIDL